MTVYHLNPSVRVFGHVSFNTSPGYDDPSVVAWMTAVHRRLGRADARGLSEMWWAFRPDVPRLPTGGPRFLDGQPVPRPAVLAGRGLIVLQSPPVNFALRDPRVLRDPRGRTRLSWSAWSAT